MALNSINPTKTEAWRTLENHYKDTQQFNLRKLFQENNQRQKQLTIQFDDFKVDFSKNLISQETIGNLLSLADAVDLKEAIEKYFSGDMINVTEKRSVLHTALRSNSEDPILVDGKDIKPQIKTTLRKIKTFSGKVISGKWRGYSDKQITDIVNIGIGGSDFGPRMVIESLKYYKNKLKTHFISNIDGDHVYEVLKNINPETTIFVIVSKTFTTQETITNANTIRDWFLNSATVFDIAKHFVAVSTNTKAVINFGIDKKNIFPIWDWVGGRFSLWSAVGITVSLALGFDKFKELLDGAEKMDIHYRTAPFEENIPVVLSLLSIWYNNFLNCESEAIFSYTHYLKYLPEYLQQAFMESNGKEVDRNGEKVDYQTGTIVWGSVGTNMQHSFMQLLHQGTKIIPSDFIGFEKPLHGDEEHHKKLMANFYGQIEALAFGKTIEEAHLDLKMAGHIDAMARLLPYKVFSGNKPSTSLIIKKLTPKNLGMLISMYEHKVFTQGVLWNIYSFDQYGVELGKELAKKMLIN
ncbi:glucose-6-phosphate isomerase [Tenacibaculum sp. C7A-26P2]|uniref:glucose-6-phosphate isomerase n=1 Tax=Tenacibaculum sp. C7A-26P2 TaxID=3447504 RepID=UPI003F83A07B